MSHDQLLKTCHAFTSLGLLRDHLPPQQSAMLAQMFVFSSFERDNKLIRPPAMPQMNLESLPKQTVLCNLASPLLASQDAQEVMYVSESVSQSVSDRSPT